MRIQIIRKAQTRLPVRSTPSGTRQARPMSALLYPDRRGYFAALVASRAASGGRTHTVCRSHILLIGPPPCIPKNERIRFAESVPRFRCNLERFHIAHVCGFGVVDCPPNVGCRDSMSCWRLRRCPSAISASLRSTRRYLPQLYIAAGGADLFQVRARGPVLCFEIRSDHVRIRIVCRGASVVFRLFAFRPVAFCAACQGKYAAK